MGYGKITAVYLFLQERGTSPVWKEAEAQGSACCRLYLGRMESRRVSRVLLISRECGILKLLEKGLKHEEIAGKLFISVTMVRFHIKILPEAGDNLKGREPWKGACAAALYRPVPRRRGCA